MPRGQRETLRARARVLLPALVLLVLFAVTACGSGRKEADARSSADPATAECRAKWSDLATQLEGNEKRPEPSALATRWTSVVATVDYYSASAKSTDCGIHLDTQEKAIAALRSFSESLRGWDMEYQLFLVETRAEGYAARPRPKPGDAPVPKRKKDRKKARDTGPPKPKAVGAALEVLRKQAPRATDDQRPAWQQAHVIDLGDKSAVKKARKDLAFLSRHSKAYRKSQAALDLIQKALKSSP